MSNPGRTNRRKTSLPKLIEKYYADLADLARQNVLFEMGLRQPFHALLAAAGKEHRWTLIAEQEKKVGGKTIPPRAAHSRTRCISSAATGRPRIQPTSSTPRSRKSAKPAT